MKIWNQNLKYSNELAPFMADCNELLGENGQGFLCSNFESPDDWPMIAS